MRSGPARAIGALCLAFPACPVSADSVYLALGDSLGWGYGQFPGTTPNGGDQGYVGRYADHLATINGGVRPTLINLSIPQETSATFFTGGQLGTLLNTNYAMTDPPTQHELMLDTIAMQQAMGNTVDHVTLHLGVNDFLGLVDTGFLDLAPDQQNLEVLRVVDQIITNITVIMDDLDRLAPDADVRLMGYYNPFGLFADRPDLDPSPTGDGVALSQVADPVAGIINDVIEAFADEYGASYVPIFDLFDGRELELTRITTLDFGSPNIHPTDAGYAVIADALIAVPAPSGAALLIAGMCLSARRQRSSARADWAV